MIKINTLHCLKAVFLAALCCWVTGAMAGLAVQPPGKTITLTVRNSSLQAALAEVAKQAGLGVSYNTGLVQQKTVTVSLNKQPLQEALETLLKGTGLKAVITKWNTLSLEKVPEAVPNAPARQRPGTLKGRIVEFETSQPLPGATVRIPALNKGVSSNENGYYRLEGLPAGTYTLEVSFVTFKTESIQVTVRAGSESTYDVKLQGDNQLGEVVVTGVTRTRAPVAHATERQVVEEIKQAQSVVSGISSEQIGKSADRNAAEVVRKIAGITVRDDKFIIIRGLNERYNMTYLNGNVAPSTELYSRAFSLDLIPSRIIDRILVYKSPAPDLSADMTGGAVKIFTKDAKGVKHFDIELQLGYRENTTFNNHFLTYQGGKFDFLGFDDGIRRLPASVPGYGDFTKARISQATYAKTFSPILTYGTKTALPTGQMTANYYNTFRLGGHSLSMLSSLSYKNEPVHQDVDRTQGNVSYPQAPSDPLNPPTLLSKLSTESQNTESFQLNLLQNFTYHLKDSSTLYFKNFLLQQGQNSTILRNTSTDQWIREGAESRWEDRQVTTYGEPRLRDILLSWSQRFLYSGNIGGSSYFGKNNKQQLDFNAGYTYSRLDVPDQRAIHLQNNTREYQIPGAGDYEQSWIPAYRSEDNLNNNIDLGMVSRIWIRNTEQVYNASADYTYKLFPWVTLKAGTYQQWKQRVVFRRIYTINEGDIPDSGYPKSLSQIGTDDPYLDFNLVLFHQQDLGQVWSDTYLRDDGTGLKVIDRTSGSDAYTATEQNNSGYAAISLLPFNGKLDIYGGLRVEYNRQRVAGALSPVNGFYGNVGSVNTPVFADLKATTYLPSLNIGFRPTTSLVLRGAYGKTVNRPEFRELSPYSELDYTNNQNILGNPDLVSATVNNYDARLEWYPRANANGESISFGAFYKDLTHPIERIINKDMIVGYAANISFWNADKAVIKGLELDIRKNFDFIPLRFFRNLSLIANGAYYYSKVTRAADTARQVDRYNIAINRQLQGQSPYSVNLGLYYDNAGTGTKIAVIGNQVGPRIYAASSGEPARYGSGTTNTTPGDLGSLIELTRRQLDLSITQRLVKSLQLKFSVQNLLDDPVQMAEDANFTYKYEKATISYPAPLNPNGTVLGLVTGDLLASDYRLGRFFLIALTYGF